MLSTSNPFIQRLIEINRRTPKRLVLPESSDPRVVAAAETLIREKAVSKLFLFSPEQKSLAPFSSSIEWVNGNALVEKTAESIRKRLAARGKSMDEKELRTIAANPLDQAAYLVSSGQGDAAVSGCVHTTADVIRAALRGIGLAPGIKTLSSCFAMLRADHAYMFADCGVVVDPTVEQLCDIAQATVDMQKALFPDVFPRVAFLSFSTKASADHPFATKMRDAAALFQKRCPNVASDGELQFDAAFDLAVGQRKAPGSAVAGQANCFIFPDLNAGNIGYKIAQRLGGFDAYGPLLQGTAKPFLDLSRGASADDIVVSCLIALLRAQT